jgi:hypothetical protein
MTTYRITARGKATGIVVFVGVVEAGSGVLAVYRAMEQWPKYGDETRYSMRAEPMLLRWPEVKRGAAA